MADHRHHDHYEVPVILYVPASCRDAAFHAIKELVERIRKDHTNDVYLADIDYKNVKEVGSE